MSNETYNPNFQSTESDFVDDRGVSHAQGDTPGSPHPPVVGMNAKRSSTAEENENKSDGTGIQVVQRQETYSLTDNVTIRPKKTNTGNPQPLQNTETDHNRKKNKRIQQPAGQEILLNQQAGVQRMTLVSPDERTKEEIPEKILKNILELTFKKPEIYYILEKLQEKCQQRGIRKEKKETSISFMFYDDGMMEDKKHDSSKPEFLCWILTGKSETQQAHCILLTNISCDEPNQVLLLDTDLPKNSCYELNPEVLNALGHLLEPKLDSEINVRILDVQQQTYRMPLCFPYTYGFAIEILKGNTSTLENIRFDEQKMIGDLIENLENKRCFLPFTLVGERDPSTRTEICFTVKWSLTDPVPAPWELRCRVNGVMYFLNWQTAEETEEDPRNNRLAVEKIDLFHKVHASGVCPIPYESEWIAAQHPEPSAPPLPELTEQTEGIAAQHLEHSDSPLAEVTGETEGINPFAQPLFEKDQASEYEKDFGGPEPGAFMDTSSPPHLSAALYAGGDMIPAKAKRSAGYEGQLRLTLPVPISQDVVPDLGTISPSAHHNQ